MSLFGEILLSRRKKIFSDFDSAIRDVADAVNGNVSFYDLFVSDNKNLLELKKILSFYDLKLSVISEDIASYKNLSDVLDEITRSTGMLSRHILLKGDWWENGDGAILAVKNDSEICALIPGRFGGYYFEENGKTIRVNKNNKAIFNPEALCFYKPLPQKSLKISDLITLIFKNIQFYNILYLLIASLIASLVGLLTPLITKITFSMMIPAGKMQLIFSMMILLLISALAVYIISIIKFSALDKIQLRTSIFLMNSFMGRILLLPIKFFSNKSSGEITQSVSNLELLPTILTDSLFAPMLELFFSFLYLVQLFSLTPELGFPALITVISQLIIISVSLYFGFPRIFSNVYSEEDLYSLSYEIFSGIQRIRLSGSENRILRRWALSYQKKAASSYPVYFGDFQNDLVEIAALMGFAWIFYAGYNSDLQVHEFAAFLSGFSLLNASMINFSEAIYNKFPYIKPFLHMAEPILKAVPESSSNKIRVKSLSGNISVSHLTFKYDNNSPLILNDISFDIKSGDYVAFVGKSGCGKSTLFRLLLGFEQPDNGAIFYDGKNLQELDPLTLRRNIGSVLQNDKLFVGDILSNIRVTSPFLSLDEAWKAAEFASIAEDIRAFPMGMKTFVSDSAGFSGGQKQRLLIARAIASKPKILLFDEATSALDNIAQKNVSDALDSLKCTRLVIAHRLSTIRHCNKIFVLDNGRIVENGTYEELINANGFFTELAKRQLL